MNFARPSRYLPALLLLGLVLINGLICSLGHGSAPAGMPALRAHPASAMHDGMDMSMDMAMPAADHAQPAPPAHSMPPGGNDCLFAGSLPLGLFVFAVFGWLLRRPPESFRAPRRLPLALPRACLPRVNPQAP